MNEDAVKKIAKLSRLNLTSEQATQHSKELKAILNYFEKLSQLETSKVEPLRSPGELQASMREDEVVKGLEPEDLTTNAPESLGNQIKVPPVV